MQANRQKIVLWMSGGLVFVAFIIVALWATNAVGWRYWRIQEASAFLGIGLPANADFATQVKPARVVWLRFSLSEGVDAVTLAKELGIREMRAGFTPFPNANAYELGIAWWKPFEAAISQGGYAIRDGRMVELAVDEVARVAFVRGYALHSG